MTSGCFLGWSGGAIVLGNFQCQGTLLIWIIVGQGPSVLAFGEDGSCLDIFLLSIISLFLSPSLWEMAIYRLKYCLRGPLHKKKKKKQQKK